MEYRGVRYELVHTVIPAGWKWIVHLNSVRTQTGFDKQLAVHAAMAPSTMPSTGKRKRRDRGAQAGGPAHPCRERLTVKFAEPRSVALALRLDLHGSLFFWRNVG